MYKHIKTSIIVSSIALAISGCSTMTDVQKDQEIERLTQELSLANQKAKQLDSANGKIKELGSKQLVQSNAVVSKTNIAEEKDINAVSNSLIPPNAKTGECYARVLVPAVYEEKSVTRLKEEAKTEIEVIPATYKVEESIVTIREASTKLVPIPATYKTETETVMVAEEKTAIVVTPATYKTEDVLISESYSTWKHGNGAIEKINDATGEIMCLVEVPAKYKTVTREVVDTPATTREVEIPCITKVVKTRVVDTPAQEMAKEIPAVYNEYTTVIKTSDSYLRWQEILCETNVTPNVISKVQKVLHEKGYNITHMDGSFGKETNEAIKAYQKDNQLSQGALTLKTLESLGL